MEDMKRSSLYIGSFIICNNITYTIFEICEELKSVYC